jgi:hypothetical protein
LNQIKINYSVFEYLGKWAEGPGFGWKFKMQKPLTGIVKW